MERARYEVKALDESSWPGFAALVEANNGIFGGCWCMGFHGEDASVATNAPKRERKLSRVRAAYERERASTPDWRIACCFVGKGHRRQGVFAAALAGALALIAGQGGGIVEGYPEPAGAVPAGFLYNGSLSTYEELGFTRDRMIGKHRWVVSKVVEPPV